MRFIPTYTFLKAPTKWNITVTYRMYLPEKQSLSKSDPQWERYTLGLFRTCFTNELTFVYSLSEPSNLHLIFPCHDQKSAGNVNSEADVILSVYQSQVQEMTYWRLGQSQPQTRPQVLGQVVKTVSATFCGEHLMRERCIFDEQWAIGQCLMHNLYKNAVLLWWGLPLGITWYILYVKRTQWWFQSSDM